MQLGQLRAKHREQLVRKIRPDLLDARKIQLHLSPLIKETFAEVNPIPIKCALYKMGMCENEYRLPLCPSTREQEIEKILRQYNLITAPHSY